MRYKDVKRAARRTRKQGNAMMVWGAPGLGKTSMFKELAQEEEINFKVFELYMHDPTDFRGMGVPNREKMVVEWMDAGLLPREDRDGAEGIILFDDLPAAPTLVQTICYPIILEGRHLPPGWWAAAAGNRKEDRGAFHAMPPALRSRWGKQVHLEANLDDWSLWALTNGIAPEVLAFVRFRPELLHDYDPKAEAYSCPRSWEKVSDEVNDGLASENVSFVKECLDGMVGQKAATEFAGFLEVINDMPNPDSCIMNPDTAPVPGDDKPSVKFALAGAVAALAKERNFDNVIAYSKRLGEEFAAFAVKDAITRDETLSRCGAYTRWCVEQGNEERIA